MTWTVFLDTVLNNTLVFATPLILAALGGVISERAGVVNIALEGFMIMGAFGAAITAFYLGDEMGLGALGPWFGLIAAFLLGMLFAVPHAVASIHFRADQVVSGVAINFLAAGFSIFMVKILFEGSAQTKTIQNTFTKVQIPGLTDIPIIGKGILMSYPTTYIAVALVIFLYYLLYRTGFGLRLRAIGEHPHAAASVGISVYYYRYIAVLLAGGFAGIGGAGMSTAISNNFSHNTIAGQGFMALAAMIFGKWHPVGAMWAALFFGFANALAANGQVLGLTKYVPAEFLNMLPFVLTILALAGVVGKAVAPAADGRPYVKGQR
ncbi:ABC transporter permease [Effusibacillus lacus]|uniref:Sugar ABC transporter permease n=1 Tax=Effusibacillus lacus TaxID=1348429 RepID=A0A292YGI7_9BACL|nr:ABC transporter permease [Effusibacillus lacus]TCS74595.1 nucleoside ABC transporter membrane protein [Effusibacillus lacus]GAX88468.1 sugar ABC transporter permease [Effusibacillus lacus]